MEKTGAERVKYSLACQHEDAIPIKFVSYAQKCPTVLCTFAVALRKESVDRNPNAVVHVGMIAWSLSARRAWIEIVAMPSGVSSMLLSLSARRAWIEICCRCWWLSGRRVALRKESVDRNTMSMSTRLVGKVALRKESVDRNLMTAGDVTAPSSRSPQGERG